MKISRKLAQEIVDKMMGVIPYNVNIMNCNGIIIGSGDASRLGGLHKGAIQAIETKKMIEIHAEEVGVFPGVNTPIIIDGQVLGVVGITGKPDEVRPFSQIVRETTTLLINQSNKIVRSQEKIRKREEFLYELIFREEKYDDAFIETAKEYWVDLSKNYICVMILSQDLDELEKTIKTKLFSTIRMLKLDAQRMILFVEDNVNTEGVYKLLNDIPTIKKMAIGPSEDLFSRSFQQAKMALEIGMKIYSSQKIYTFDEMKFLAGLKHNRQEEIVDLVTVLKNAGKHLELVLILKKYIQHRGDMTKVAECLNIHRNTLRYRLNKIEELTGKNCNDYIDLMELICGIVWSEND